MASSVKINGQLVRGLREQRGIERSELADAIGVSYHRLYMLEQQGVNTRPMILRKIAEELGVQPEDLKPGELVKVPAR